MYFPIKTLCLASPKLSVLRTPVPRSWVGGGSSVRLMERRVLHGVEAELGESIHCEGKEVLTSHLLISLVASPPKVKGNKLNNDGAAI